MIEQKRNQHTIYANETQNCRIEQSLKHMEKEKNRVEQQGHRRLGYQNGHRQAQ